MQFEDRNDLLTTWELNFYQAVYKALDYLPSWRLVFGSQILFMQEQQQDPCHHSPTVGGVGGERRYMAGKVFSDEEGRERETEGSCPSLLKIA